MRVLVEGASVPTEEELPSRRFVALREEDRVIPKAVVGTCRACVASSRIRTGKRQVQPPPPTPCIAQSQAVQ